MCRPPAGAAAGADRQRPAAAPPPGLGTARLPAERNRIPATPARLCLRLFELWPLARRRSQRPGRASRLIAFAGLLMACFRQSKRRAAHFLSLILNQPASRRLAGRVAEPRRRRRAAGLRRTGPTTAARCLCCPWMYHRPRQARPRPGFGSSSLPPSPTSPAAPVGVPKCRSKCWATFDGVIHCDRARMYWALGGRLQWCWKFHLKRDFQALCDGPCRVGKRLGHDLLRPTNQLFALWQKVRDGTLSRCAFQKQMRPLPRR